MMATPGGGLSHPPSIAPAPALAVVSTASAVAADSDSPSPARIRSGSATGTKRKHSGRSKKANDESDESGDEEGQRKKRNRMALSCRECKRRKIKCSREMPYCKQCEKRGDAPANCTWDILQNEGSLPSTIARTTEVEAVMARLAHVEAYLRTLPPNLASFKPYVPSESEQNRLPVGVVQLARPEVIEETFENAAVDLEDGVFGSRATTAFRKDEDDQDMAGLKEFQDIVQIERGGGPPRRNSRGGQSDAGPGRPARERRFGGSSVELTKALTSIVQPDQNNLQIYTSRVTLNVEFNASPEEVELARIEAIQRIYRALPPRQVIDHLVSLYFTRVSWLFHHLHAPSFMMELEAFHDMLDAGRELEVDILWVALLLMVICVALDSTHSSRSPLSLADPTEPPPSPTPLSPFTDEYLRALPEVWFQAAQSALALGEWETIPRIRSIQTIIFFTEYLQLCSPTRGQPSQLVTWLSGAIRIATVLGLHLLGSNPEVMPPDDPAFPPGKNSVKREQAKRLWGVLVYQDWSGASSKNRSYIISPFHFDTDDPFNINDSELSPIDWKVDPLPPDVLTDATADRVRIAMSRQFRKVFDAVVLTKDFTYDTVLELDRGYHAILESLPDRWTLGVTAEETEKPILRYQRHFALEGLHNRIFRLHRPFSTRGYSQPKYRFSTDACIRSARVVVVSTHNISDACKDIWYTYSHVLSAALILFNDLFQAIDQDLPTAEYESKKHTLFLAAQIFSHSEDIVSPELRSVVEQGSKILSGLFRAEESRRIARAAQTLVSASGGAPTDGDTTEMETFSEVLQRISRSLNGNSAPHCGTPPPTRNLPKPAARHSLQPSQATAYPFMPTSSSLPLEPTPAAGMFPELVAPAFDHTLGPTPQWAAMGTSGAPLLPMDDFSNHFFQDLRMLDSSAGSLSHFWNGPEVPSHSAELRGAGEPRANGESATVGANWFEHDDAQDQMANLLGQLSGTTGW